MSNINGFDNLECVTGREFSQFKARLLAVKHQVAVHSIGITAQGMHYAFLYRIPDEAKDLENYQDPIPVSEEQLKSEAKKNDAESLPE